MNSRRAFTLIELLVVIAIIAILAAILFPVFAQARQAARGAASMSNVRQLATAVLMYTQDYDETFPIFTRWGDGPITLGGTPLSTWAFDVAPYIKNNQIFSDPMVGGIRQASAVAPFYTHYGYNYTTLSPYTGSFGATPWRYGGASIAAINRPADVVMLAGRFTVEEAGAIYWYGSGTMTTQGGAEPPDCTHIPAWCFDDWGINGNYSILQTEAAGRFSGGVSLRKQNNANFSFTDGHAKFMQAGQGARGTNWFKGISSGSVVITDPTVYAWHQSP